MRQFGAASAVQDYDCFTMASIPKPITGEWIARRRGRRVHHLGHDHPAGDARCLRRRSQQPLPFVTVRDLMAHASGMPYSPLTIPAGDYSWLPFLPIAATAT